MLALLRAAHPEPAATVTVVSGLLAVAVGHGPGGTALVTATVAASQLATGWCNDALDADRDAALGRTDKPIVTGAISRRAVAVASALAAAATVVLATGLGPWPTVAAAVGLVSALAYNWPVKLTGFSPLPYAISFAALPAFVVGAVPATPPVWLVAAGGLLGLGAHFANVLPDLPGDVATGVRGLPHRLGTGGSAVAAAAFLLAATVVLVVGPPGPPSWVGLAALAGALVVLPAAWYADRAAAGPRTTFQFRAFFVVALLDVGLLLAGGTVL